MTPADLRFAIDKAPAIVEHLVANLRACTLPHITRLSAPAVLIVGAGPTLDLGRVKAAFDAGISIWTTNTCARAVCEVVPPDVVVVRESLDVSDHLRDLAYRPHVIACDLSAHPNVWVAAGDAGAFFVPASPHTFAIAAMLDVAPLYGGTASLTAAVALAHAGGARWIGLEGVDLAYGRDGRGYAAGARYAASIARVDGTLATLSGGVEQRELAERSGQRPPPTIANVHLVHAREGGPLHASGPWLSQVEWLESFAARRPQAGAFAARDRGLGLAALDGWPTGERGFDDVSNSADFLAERFGFWPERARVDPDRLAVVLADVERQCRLAGGIADAVESGGDPSLLPDLVDGAPLVDTHAAGAAAGEGSFAERVAVIYGANRASAERLAA